MADGQDQVAVAEQGGDLQLGMVGRLGRGERRELGPDGRVVGVEGVAGVIARVRRQLGALVEQAPASLPLGLVRVRAGVRRQRQLRKQRVGVGHGSGC